jgi:hypothetical protein
MWCFAIVNGKLAEIYFDKKNNKSKIWGHCYVKTSEFTIKKELNQIKKDTEKFKFVYRNKIYMAKKTL